MYDKIIALIPTDDGYLDENRVIKWLEERKYVLRDDWHWTPPAPDHVVTDDEDTAITWLMQEWDFGGVIR